MRRRRWGWEAYLPAKLVTAVVFAGVVSLLLMLLGATVGKVVLELAGMSVLFFAVSRRVLRKVR